MNKLVLIVDDEAELREAIASLFEMEGFTTIEAKNGHQALEIVKNNKDIQFVLSDLRMPNGNGVYLTEELRKIDPVKPYIVLLSGQDDISREQAIKLGALDMFLKPPDMKQIIELIKKQLNIL